MRIDFIGVGTQKGGTTSLNRYLSKHKDICIPEREMHFFDDETQDWESPGYDSYHAYFNASESGLGHGHASVPATSNAFNNDSPRRVRGEITPIYMYWEPSIERIYRYNPDAKLIILLRNPTARAFSHWAMEKSRYQENLCFSEALRQESARCAQAATNNQHRIFSYLERSRYSLQLKRILRFFSHSQILVLRSEELFREPHVSLLKVTNFLEVTPLTRLGAIHARQGVYPVTLSHADWKFMVDELESDISSLETLLDWDCSEWRRPWM
jgi:hypothetical protein